MKSFTANLITIDPAENYGVDLATGASPVTVKYNPHAPANPVQPGLTTAVSLAVTRWDGVNPAGRVVDPSITWELSQSNQALQRALVPGNGRFLIVATFDGLGTVNSGTKDIDAVPATCTLTWFNANQGKDYSVTIMLEDGNIPEIMHP